MFPPVFDTLYASTAVKALLGSNPMRFYVFGQAEQGTALPYGVFQTVSGVPENYLGSRSDSDADGEQLDFYGSTLTSVRAVASAARTALEPVAYITAYREMGRDPVTNSFRISMDVDFITPR